MAKKTKTLSEPLLVRPGARYTCSGDGLCCTDIHGLGAVEEHELVQIRKIDERAVAYDDDFEDYMLVTAADGGCHFLLPDMRCHIHGAHGPELKPEGCRRFPFGLAATPRGGRVTTMHRCPCRTLGDRPPLDPVDAARSLLGEDGALRPDRHIRKLRLARKGKKVSFEEWEALEEPILTALRRGRPARAVLGARPFPTLKHTDWVEVAREYVQNRDGSQFGMALSWFGDTVLSLVEESQPRPPVRTWIAAFDRAEARSPEPRTARAVLNDWVMDEIWSLEWAETSSWDVAAAALTTQVAVAEAIADRLRAAGQRPDRAAAEAVTVVELVGHSEHWTGLVEQMRP